MAQPATLVERVRAQVTRTLDELLKLRSLSLDEYNALGGATFVEPYFEDAQGNPRTDLDITHQQFIDGIASAQKLTDVAIGDKTNLFVLKV